MNVSEQTADASASNGAGSVRRWRLGGDRMTLEIYLLMPDGARKDGWRKGAIINFVFRRWGSASC